MPLVAVLLFLVGVVPARAELSAIVSQVIDGDTVELAGGERVRLIGIHPQYTDIKVVCACGNSFETKSTLGRDLNVEICSACHPFYTGKQKIVDTAGRVGRFKARYQRK